MQTTLRQLVQTYERLFPSMDVVREISAWFSEQDRRFLPLALVAALEDALNGKLLLLPALIKWIEPENAKQATKQPDELSEDIELSWFNTATEKEDFHGQKFTGMNWPKKLEEARKELGLFTSRQDLIIKLREVSQFDKPSVAKTVERLRAIRRHQMGEPEEEHKANTDLHRGA